MKMHLTREVRFSVNPFQNTQIEGYNPYASKPATTGLGLFFELGIEVSGPIDPKTGFVVNVCEIDQSVRSTVVPLFVDRICNCFSRGRNLTLSDLDQLLRISCRLLGTVFDSISLETLTLKLNPYRKMAFSALGEAMVYYSEKFEFAAMHKLWNDSFDKAKNDEIFGKCANPAGHGHNYIIEVTIKASEASKLDPINYERAVDTSLINILDHKNLNEDVPYFQEHNPTMENIAKFAWSQLLPELGLERLHCITVWESDRTQCSYFGP